MPNDESKETIPICPHCRSNQDIIRNGIRQTKSGPVQIYQCKTCKKHFTTRTLPGTTYTPKLILAALTYFNTGHTLAQTSRYIYRKFKQKPPVSTVKTWTDRYADDLSFIPIRKSLKTDPAKLTKTSIMVHPRLKHFKVHPLKHKNARERFPNLGSFIDETMERVDGIFFSRSSNVTCSDIVKEISGFAGSVQRINNNPVCRMVKYALELFETHRDQRAKILEFFLINDDTTVAGGVPVWLTAEEATSLGLPETIIMDDIGLLHVKNDELSIMDYRPDQESKNTAIKELTLKAKILSVRTGIHQDRINLAYFDELEYFEILPIRFY